MKKVNLSLMKLKGKLDLSEVKDIKLVNDKEWDKDYLVITFNSGKSLVISSGFNHDEGVTFLRIEEVD